MWHIPLWPFTKVDAWLRRHYEKKQIQEQIALQQRQLLLETTPQLDVSFHLIRNPDPPRRSDIPIIDVVVRNYGGMTKIIQGRFWTSLSNDPAYKEEKHLAEVQMPKGKEEHFFLPVLWHFFDQVVAGNAVLKFHYDLESQDANGKSEHRADCYQYEPTKNVFKAV